MSDIHIVIPSLLSPLLLWQKDFLFTPTAPVFSTLLARRQCHQHTLIGMDRTLFSLLGWPNKQELPSAYYRYQLDFGSEPDAALMCADPVHLAAGVDEIILSPERIDDLSHSDAEELIDTLNQHFAQDNWQFIQADSGRFYLQYQQQEHIDTTPLDVVRGQSIFNYLPQSARLNWHSLQNEIQMLLHMSSLNQSREIAGQKAVNSLWFWGAGTPQDAALTYNISAIWGSQINAKIAAQAANIKQHALPQHYDQLGLGQHIIVFDHLYEAALQDDYHHWQAQLNLLEETHINPLIQWAKKHRKTLHIHTCDGQTFVIPNKRNWKFWQKPTVALQHLCKAV